MLRANDGHIIVRVTNNSDTTPGGIVLPENAIKPSNIGVVVDSNDYDMCFEKDQVIYFPLYIGHTIEYNGEKLLVLKTDDVLAYEVSELSDDSDL